MAETHRIARPIELRNQHSNIDYQYGPYTSVAEACSSIPLIIRGVGKTVGILGTNNTILEYWFQGGIDDINLIKKIEKGEPGRDGKDGKDGERGSKGDTGNDGRPGLDGAIQYQAGDNITISEDNTISANLTRKEIIHDTWYIDSENGSPDNEGTYKLSPLSSWIDLVLKFIDAEITPERVHVYFLGGAGKESYRMDFDLNPNIKELVIKSADELIEKPSLILDKIAYNNLNQIHINNCIIDESSDFILENSYLLFDTCGINANLTLIDGVTVNFLNSKLNLSHIHIGPDSKLTIGRNNTFDASHIKINIENGSVLDMSQIGDTKFNTNLDISIYELGLLILNSRKHLKDNFINGNIRHVGKVSHRMNDPYVRGQIGGGTDRKALDYLNEEVSEVKNGDENLIRMSTDGQGDIISLMDIKITSGNTINFKTDDMTYQKFPSTTTATYLIQNNEHARSITFNDTFKNKHAIQGFKLPANALAEVIVRSYGNFNSVSAIALGGWDMEIIKI